MRRLDYNKDRDLENLLSTIDAILFYKWRSFKAKNLAKRSKKMKHGQSFGNHLAHLVETGYLSKEKYGETKTAVYQYHVKDWVALKKYRHFISLLLNPSPKTEGELEKIKQI